jgi:hypothetical protein
MCSLMKPGMWWTLRVIFTEDIKQDYLVLGEEVFYNWP